MTTDYPIHTVDTAPADSKPLLQGLKDQIGMIPNLAATMAESPGLLRGFLALREVQANGTFSAAEIQVLSLTNAYENGCRYCMALHSKFALNEGVEPSDVEALRQGRSPEDPRLGALSDFSRTLVAKRGKATQADLAAFRSAGYSAAQALEVVLSAAVSTMPNFAHHLTGCAIDPAFEGSAV